MKKILISETILIERQYVVESVPSVNQVSIAHEMNSLTSSKAINAGRMMTKKSDVYMFGCVGKEVDGERAVADLKKYGIKPTYVTSTDKNKTGEVIVVTGKQGDSAIILYLGANENSNLNTVKNLAQFDFVYAATSMTLLNLYELIRRCNKEKVGIFLDFPNRQKEFDKKYLKTVDFVVPNRQEAGLLLNSKIITIADALEAASALKKFTDGNVIITLDSDGCVVLDKNLNGPIHIETRQIDVVDTTASGDIFRGIFLSEYLESKDLISSAKKAVKTATESCKVSGVDNSIKQSLELI